MTELFSFLKTALIVFGVIIVLFMILLSLPKSHLRGVVLKIVGFTLKCVTGLSVIYMLNPIDIIPDFIPVLGQVDDAGALIVALFTGVTGVLTSRMGKSDIESVKYIEHK